MPQWYPIMKARHLSRRMHWWFPHLKQFIETKGNNNGSYTTTKNSNVSISRHVPLSINYSLTTTSHAVHKATYCLLRHGIPLFLKGSPKVIEVLGCRVSSLYTATQLIPQVFNGIQVWRKCRPFHLRYTSLQQPFPDDATSMSRSIVVHEDEIRPVLFM